MSWSTSSRNTYPCSCGEGTYTVHVEVDDWNRQRDNRVIHCPECAKKEKEHEMEIVNERKRLRELDEEVRIYFAEHYMEQWVKYFAPTKNKKEKWTLANDMGIEGGSISTFYNRWKSRGMDEYIRSLANYNNMHKIIQVLHIEDSRLSSKTQQALELEKREHSRAVSNWHRNR
ncbi:hypothetical protein [Sporosarcina sp. G11-34]|uniref:hypothetical protein n=1 Tax=Sporosarcina sp. G11-34 TaxID=2849605 RepID=UPI0022A909C9|nr:hypothetical protein [Sporosarcina sp. G11-34]MCZ2260633.1 hypothetical protein [Sporosarcina sp. G11-34]